MGPITMPEHDCGSLFPLPLVPFERYMLADDRPGYPMTFLLRVEFQGIPDRPCLDAAFRAVLERHPLLSARHCPRMQTWQPVSPPTLNWFAETDPPVRVRRPIDLAEQAGLVADVAIHGDGGSLTFLFHHAVCDAIGGLRLIGDLLTEYARRVDHTTEAVLLPLDEMLLRQRGRFDLQIPHPVPVSTAMIGLGKEAWKVLSRRPAVLGGVGPSGTADRGDIPVLHLPSPVRGQLRERAAELGVTTNDLLLRDLFLTLREWNAGQGERGRRGWLRINMPTSLRSGRDAVMPAANLLGYALLTRRARDCDNGAALLTSLAAETAAVRTWGLGSVFVAAIGALDSVPGLLRRVVMSSRQFATLILSNLGDPCLRFSARLPQTSDDEILAGNLRVTQLYGVPPIRPGTRAAIMVSGYAGRLAIAINADPRWLDTAGAERFLENYRRHIEQSAEGEVAT